MKVLITGGAGFIASHLADKLVLLSKIDKIYLLDNLIRTNGFRNIKHLFENPKIQFIYGDVSNFDFYSLPDYSEIKQIYHLAATRINRCVSYNEEGHRFIADGGFNVVNFACKNHSKLFFASTASVYQNVKEFPILEDSICNPHTIYGSAKFYTENLIRSFDKMYDFNYTINRFFSVYGERMDSEGAYTEVIFNWLNNVKNGNNHIKVYGDAEQKILDLVYVDDVVKIIIATMFGTNKEVFNVSTENGIKLMDLITTIEKVTGIKFDIEFLPENRTDIEQKRIGSMKKIREFDPSLLPSITLEDGIRKTFEWIKQLN